ncbi:MAG: site-specific integrase [Butyrivibrio sp.]|nr:site-specific integrase [Butyrivibrio sp.]
MTIEKRASGNYRIVQMVNGKRYRITVDHKPTQSEAFRLLAEKVEENTISVDMPFKRACDSYIESKSNVLSVSSIRGYKGIMRQISPDFMNTKLSAITLPAVQTQINSYSVDHSPKSVYNMSGFIMGVLKYYGVKIESPKLPQKEKKAPYIPTKEEVSAIFKEIKGTVYEVPIMLAAMGLRRSEICALTVDDLKGNILTINKAKVLDSEGIWHIKSTKTTESTRDVVIPNYLADLIREQGFIYNGGPNVITQALERTQKKLGIPYFTLHKLRHFFASYMHDQGFTDKQIQDMGGWKTDNVMKSVYTHSMQMDEAKSKASAIMGGLM